MADWSKPALTDTYANFLSLIDARLNDAATMFASYPTHAPNGTIRWNTSLNCFEKYTTLFGGEWQTVTLSLAGGGMGGNDAASVRAAAELGSIATQNSNAIAITGGTLSGISSLALTGLLSSTGKIQTSNTASDALKTGGGITAGSGAVGIVDTTGKIPAISSTYFASLSGANLTSIPYAALSGAPTIPTLTSQLTNDSGFLTSGSLPSKLSDFTNDIGAIPSTVTSGPSYAVTGNITGLNDIKCSYLYLQGTNDTTASLSPVVFDSVGKILRVKTNGISIIFNSFGPTNSLTFENGILVGWE